MAYVGIWEGVKVWLGVFRAVMVGVSVGVFVGTGVKVWVASAGMTVADVFVGEGKVSRLVVAEAVNQAVSAVLAKLTWVRTESGLHAVPMVIIIVQRMDRLLILLRKTGIEISLLITILEISIRYYFNNHG
jgi:hypothetical protein